MKEELIIRFLNGECTEEELMIVKKWINDPLHKEQFDQILNSRWEDLAQNDFSNEESKKQASKIFKNIDKSLIKAERQKPNKLNVVNDLNFNLIYYFRMAACFLLFPLAGFIFFTYFFEGFGHKEKVTEVNILHKYAGIGEKLKVRLPDGSFVSLNSGSSIHYPEIFSDSLRNVELSGEAFFEVVSESERPFKVVTDAAITTVLGTFFNIKDRNGIAEITLTEGKVKVELEEKEKVVLNPGEMAIANSLLDKVTVEEVDINEVITWKNGIINFKNHSLMEVFSKLENWYGVKINCQQGINLSNKISGEFNNENLDNILSGLSFSFDFNYKINGKEVSIFNNKQI